MSFLLPQTREGVVQSVRLVDIHGDRYLDVALSLEDGATAHGRVSVLECPPDLAAGDLVSARFTMGVMTTVTRTVALLVLALGLCVAVPRTVHAAPAPAAPAAQRAAREPQQAHVLDSLSVSAIAHMADPRARLRAWEGFLAQHPHSDFRELAQAALDAERHAADLLHAEDTPMSWVVARGTVYYSNRGYDAEHQDPVVAQVELLLPPPGSTPLLAPPGRAAEAR